MILAVHINVLYLSETKACSRSVGHFFLSKNAENLANNETVLTIAHTIKNIMFSAEEAELGAIYINFREDVPDQHTLEDMGHKQPPTPVQTDNTTALRVVKNNVTKKLKLMDMKIHWLHCR